MGTHSAANMSGKMAKGIIAYNFIISSRKKEEYFVIFICGILIYFMIIAWFPEYASRNLMNFILYGSLILWILKWIIKIANNTGVLSALVNMCSTPKNCSVDFASKIKPVAISQVIDVDQMEGHAFEYWCANFLRNLGYQNVDVTPGSGDQGVDIVAVKDGIKYAFQCKRYSSRLGNTPVQEVYAGMEMYGCSVGVVITNNYFTAVAVELANRTGVWLWDRDDLTSMIGRVGKTETDPLTNEEIAYYKALPHIEKEDWMPKFEYLYFADGNIVDPCILGLDEVLDLVSKKTEFYDYAEHLAKVIEKHFYAKAEVRRNDEEQNFYVFAKVRVRNIMSNFREGCFVVPTWA